METTTEHDAAVLLGRKGGSTKTPAKAAASRANGKLGGRKAKHWKELREKILTERPQCEMPTHGKPPACVIIVPRKEGQ
jgi:hypothetical protein